MSQTTTVTLPATRGEAELEAQLTLMTSAVARCFERSEGEDRTHFQSLRSDEIGNAARLIALSAEMGHALAKLRGKFEHEIRVVRGPDARAEAARALTQVIEAEPLPTPARK
ncbi:MAG TPA: hypothetical protein VGM36_05060 [Rhizomicrobium sp.]|jgi:hypothetical protein